MDEYLQERQTEALRLSALIGGMCILANEGTRDAQGAAIELLDILATMAKEHLDALDSINRPKVTA